MPLNAHGFYAVSKQLLFIEDLAFFSVVVKAPSFWDRYDKVSVTGKNTKTLSYMQNNSTFIGIEGKEQRSYVLLNLKVHSYIYRFYSSERPGRSFNFGFSKGGA